MRESDGGEILGRRALIRGLVGAAGAAALIEAAKAGPLTPPAGPVAPTGKTLAEIEPRTAMSQATTPGDAGAVFAITQPGSYYLTGHLDVPAGKMAIRVSASDVVIDLNGFRINGNLAAGTSGISDQGNAQEHITIRNGSIENTTGIGIFMLSTQVRMIDLMIRGNSGYGVLTANRVFLERVSAIGNAATAGSNAAGILVASESLLLDCHSASNTGVGINAGAYAVLARCSAEQNTREGITVGATALVQACVSQGNGLAGITMQHSGVADGCVSISNGGVGISGSFGAIVRECAAVGNSGGGITVWEGALVARCTAHSNTGDGIILSTGCLATGCMAASNTLTGVNGSNAPGSAILGCAAQGNSQSGIVGGARSTLRQNACEANSTAGPGAAGILVTGVSSRVEGNVCQANFGYGVWVNATRNMIADNSSAANNLNWNLFSNCIYGPVIDRTSPGTSAMSGNGTVASTMGSTDPFGNFSY